LRRFWNCVKRLVSGCWDDVAGDFAGMLFAANKIIVKIVCKGVDGDKACRYSYFAVGITPLHFQPKPVMKPGVGVEAD